jgi:hypothetical protein
MPTENYWVTPIIFVIFGFLVFTFIRSSVLDTINLSVRNDSIRISRLFGINRRIFQNSEILGYSNSEIEIGRTRFKVKTIILYGKNNEVYELIKYNYWNFSEVCNFIETYPYLGMEPYSTGLYFRQYKFKTKHNNK